MIIYNGAIGPYESHEDVDQIYFVRHGTAKAAYGRPLDQPDGDRAGPDPRHRLHRRQRVHHRSRRYRVDSAQSTALRRPGHRQDRIFPDGYAVIAVGISGAAFGTEREEEEEEASNRRASNRFNDAVNFVCLCVAAVGLSCCPSHMAAQAPPPTEFPDTVTVSPGPKTNLFPHVMKKAEVLAALAQVKDSQDLFVKSNAAVTLRVSSNTRSCRGSSTPMPTNSGSSIAAPPKSRLAPFSLQLGVTPPGNTYRRWRRGHRERPQRNLAYQIMPTSRPVRICRAPEICIAADEFPASRRSAPAMAPPLRR